MPNMALTNHRVLLKFHADTLTGYQLLPTVTPEEMTKFSKKCSR
jgi:hypothetical protein